jgi:hypothetical protein
LVAVAIVVVVVGAFGLDDFAIFLPLNLFFFFFGFVHVTPPPFFFEQHILSHPNANEKCRFDASQVLALGTIVSSNAVV